MDMDFQLSRERTIGFERVVVFFASEMLEQRLAVYLHHVADLGGLHIIGALGGGLADQFGALLETWLGQQGGAHLHHGGGEGVVSAHVPAFSPASKESSLPSRSRV